MSCHEQSGSAWCRSTLTINSTIRELGRLQPCAGLWEIPGERESRRGPAGGFIDQARGGLCTCEATGKWSSLDLLVFRQRAFHIKVLKDFQCYQNNQKCKKQHKNQSKPAVHQLECNVTTPVAPCVRSYFDTLVSNKLTH